MNLGDGATSVAVKEENGKVILAFPKPVAWAALDPETARQAAEAIARASYKGRYGIELSSKESAISKEVRDRLLVRATHIIRSLREQGKTDAYIASHVVDHILSEVK